MTGNTLNDHTAYCSGNGADGFGSAQMIAVFNDQSFYASGGSGDGQHSAAVLVFQNEQGFYCSGGVADGADRLTVSGFMGEQNLYCKGGVSDGFSLASYLGNFYGFDYYCYGGSGDGFHFSATVPATLNNQSFYCLGGQSDGYSDLAFSGSMADFFYASGGYGDGACNLPSGSVFLGRGFWTGLVSSDWFNSGNWNAGEIPTAETHVNIPGNPKGEYFPLINSGTGALCNSLTIQASAALTVPQGNSLAVSDNFVIQSDANGIGSFIDEGPVSVGGTTRVDLYLSPDSWHYVASPVADAQSGVFLGDYLYSFTESLYDWFNIVPVTVPLSPMQGFAAWVYDNPDTVKFQGPLNSGDYSIDVTRNSTLTNQGWNLVGNPYPSSADWDAPNGWVKNNVDNTIYFYKGAGGLENYRYYIGETGESPPVGINEGTNEIPPMQGFFVHASANGSLTINNNARIHSNQPYYKQTFTGTVPMARLRVSGGGRADETVVRFVEKAGMAFDGKYDAYKLFSTDFPQLYTVTPEEAQLAVNSMPVFDEGAVVPLGFIPFQETGYAIELTELTGLQDVYLEDLFTGIFQRMNDNPVYSFEGSLQDAPARFLLHFGLTDDPVGAGPYGLDIYSYGNTVFIRNKESGSGKAYIYSIPGHAISTNVPVENGITRINILSGTGFYIVKVMTGKTLVTQKVFIKN